MSVEIVIVQNEMKYQAEFKQLNEAWIATHFQLEKSDIEVLSNPQKYILANGGLLFVALESNKVLGCVALIAHGSSTCELAKFAVDSQFQSQGVGYLLGKTLLQKAKSLCFKRIYLEGSTLMPASIHLYHKLGFNEVENFNWIRSTVINAVMF